MSMPTPENKQLPFFAYGIFKRGQIAFFQIAQFVDTLEEPRQIAGTLLLRDGLPILDVDGNGQASGSLIHFSQSTSSHAYGTICALEPQTQYRWITAEVGGKTANVLAGISPNKGSTPLDEGQWNSWRDPLFNEALGVIKDTLRLNSSDASLNSIFHLQMAYLLLWSAIERYLTLRYGLGQNVTSRVNQLANEPAFSATLRGVLKAERKVFRADDPTRSYSLTKAAPRKAVEYYYQIRNNIMHRGKAQCTDFLKVRDSLDELLQIFTAVLKSAQREATPKL